jgi:DedD protein
MAETDAQLELKKQARRRLVGAIALAVTAAVVLPMVMDEEPPTGGDDVLVRIPNPESETLSTRPLGQRPAGASGTLGMPDRPPVGAKPGEAPNGRAPAQSAASSPPSGRSGTGNEPGSAGSGQQEAAASPVGSDTGNQDKAGGSRGGSEKENAVKGAPVGGGERYVVQLGVFANAENARKIQARVKAQGFSVFTEQVEGDRTRTRVRAGPFVSRDAAETARDKLKRAGLPGIVALQS